MSKKIIVLLLFLICAVTIYIIKNPKKPNTLSSPITLPYSSSTPTFPTESSLSFIPDTIYTLAGQKNEVNIRINSQGKYATGAQLELAYDPTILTDITLTPGTLFPNPNILLNNNDEKSGRISYALSLNSNDKPRNFSGTTAIIKFKVRENTLENQTTIYFLPKTTIISQSGNIPLKIAYGLKILINTEPSITASQSPSLKE